MKALLHSLSRVRSGRAFAASVALLWAAAWIVLGRHVDARSAAPRADISQSPRTFAATNQPTTPAYVTKKIQDIRVGDRVMAHNPELTEEDRRLLAELEPEPNAETWRHLSLRMTCELPDGEVDNVEIELLRPLDWIAAYGAAEGETIFLDMEEMDVVGPAQVLSIAACPDIKPGSGRVVTGTFAHTSNTVHDLHVSGLSEPIGVTAKHRFWSEDRRAFVAAEDLVERERLRGASGAFPQVSSVETRPGEHPVYNIEVHGEHVYHVARDAILVHNEYVLYQKLSAAGDHLKFGITNNPRGRYTAKELAGGRLKILARGSKDEMLSLERALHETLPLGAEEGQLVYILIQMRKGLRPPTWWSGP